MQGAAREPLVLEGDLVCLADAKGERTLVRAARETARVPGLGVLDLGALVGVPWGGAVRFGSVERRVLPPSTLDRVAAIERRAQIVQPKDAARIVLSADLRAGRRVLEAGAGSGALTIALASAVAPGGRVVTCDVREDHLRVARGNVERAGLGDAVDFRLCDVSLDPPEGPFDAVVLDLPEPEKALPAVADRLAGGGHVCCYTPLVGQAEAARRALDALGFGFAETIEVLERELVVHARGSRPAHEGLAHTAYLTFARKLV